MPIRTISGRDAVANLRDNPVARWPHRAAESNRIEPVASPKFTPSFRFSPGATVFTIGSCFARHIEAALERRGFVLPTRQFWSSDSSGRATDNWMLDNYGVPAIYNEISWAFGETPYDPARNIIEVQPGLFADAHLSGRVRLEPYEAVLQRRERIFDVTRSLLDADILVITLGLAEVWMDTASRTYLNTRPHPATLQANVDRFELHVLAYDDVIDYLSRTFEIVFRRCRTALKVLLTVSPVPMAATFTGRDVAIANQYSKSVLRAAAEQIADQYRQIDYFPSYESIVLSDRALTWEDDLVHVRQDLIEHNVSAMIAAYTGEAQAVAASQNATPMPAVSEHRDLERARNYLRQRQFDKAIAAAVLLFDSPLHAQALRVQASAHLALRRPAAAELAMRAALELRFNDGAFHGLLGRALLMQGRSTEAVEALQMATRYAPGSPVWNGLHAEALFACGRIEEAEVAIQDALRQSPEHPRLLQLAETFRSASK